MCFLNFTLISFLLRIRLRRKLFYKEDVDVAYTPFRLSLHNRRSLPVQPPNHHLPSGIVAKDTLHFLLFIKLLVKIIFLVLVNQIESLFVMLVSKEKAISFHILFPPAYILSLYSLCFLMYGVLPLNQLAGNSTMLALLMTLASLLGYIF